MKNIYFTLAILTMITSLGYSQTKMINLNSKETSNKVEMNNQERSQVSSFDNSKRARHISFNDELRSINISNIGDNIVLDIFNDKNYNSVIENVSTDINGTKTIVVKITNFDYAYCFINISDDAISMNIDVPELNEKYITRINPLNNANYLLQLDETNLDILEGGPSVILDELQETPNQLTPDFINDDSQQRENVSPENINLKLGVDDAATINVMIVYSPAAAAWANTNEGSINNTIADAMTKANLASTNSNLGITYNLVYSGQVTYTEVDASSDLSALRTNGDGEMDNVHTLRNSNLADMVVMFTKEDEFGGLGYVLQNRYGREDLAFCINRVQQVSGTYTMIHEMGHNMGASHHAQQNYQEGPTEWNDWAENTWTAGWRWTGSDAGKYCDLMTYENGSYFADGVTHTRTPYFSNPNINYSSQPTGHASLGDNARTLRETKHCVANYRSAESALYCSAGVNTVGYSHFTNVELGTIDVTTSYASYTDLSNISTDVTPGVDHQLTMTKSSTYSYEVIVWVDWNDDKDFTDSGEEVYKSGASSSSTYITNINPPLGTEPGTKRMRLRIHSTSTGPNTTPCGNSDRGEVEDYTLNVLSTESYDVTFNVTDGSDAISGADITFNSTTQQTNGSGQTIFSEVPPGTNFDYFIEKADFHTTTGTVDVTGNTIVNEIILGITYDVTFNVTDGSDPVSGADVTFNSTTQQTNGSGQTIFSDVEEGSGLGYSIAKSGHHTTTGTANVSSNTTVSPVLLSNKAAINLAVQGSPTSNSVTLSWTGTGADYYQIRYNQEGTTNYSWIDASSSPFTIYNLNPSTAYECKIKSYISGQYTDFTGSTTFTTSSGSQVLATSLAVQGSPTANAATLTWTGSGASYYQLRYNQTGTTNYSWVNTSSSPFTINNLNPSTEYECRIKTNNGSQYSNWSDAVTFSTTAGAQVLATNLAVQGSPTTNAATLTWTGSGATYYQLRYNQTGTTNYSWINTSSSPFTLHNLNPDTEYECRIKTNNGGQFSNWSSAVTFSTTAGAQILATSLAVQGSPTANSVTLSWTGTGASYYQLRYNQTGTTNYSWINTSASPFTIYNLNPDTEYECRIKTNNGGQYSNWSSAVTFSTTAGSQLLATNLAVQGSPQATSVTMSWNGSGASYYQLRYNISGTTDYTWLNTTSSPLLITNLSESTDYECRIKTNTGGQYSNWSDAVLFTTSETKSLNTFVSKLIVPESIKLTAYPNPFVNELIIKIRSTSCENATLLISDISGKMIIKESILTNVNYKYGDILKSGIYFVNVFTESGLSKSAKIIKID